MKHFIYLFSILLLFAVNINVYAQGEPSPANLAPGLREHAVTIEVESRVLGPGKVVFWSNTNSQVIISGNPMGVQLEGSNVIVSVQFTPFINRDGNVLVAQGHFWIADSNGTVTYYTSVQTIPMILGQKIYYYPLGSAEHLNPSIEMVINVTSESSRSRRNTPNVSNER